MRLRLQLLGADDYIYPALVIIAQKLFRVPHPYALSPDLCVERGFLPGGLRFVCESPYFNENNWLGSICCWEFHDFLAMALVQQSSQTDIATLWEEALTSYSEIAKVDIRKVPTPQRSIASIMVSNFILRVYMSMFYPLPFTLCLSISMSQCLFVRFICIVCLNSRFHLHQSKPECQNCIK